MFAVALIGLTANAFAGDKVYLGLDFGRTSSSQLSSERSVGFAVGYHFDENLAVEGFYRDFSTTLDPNALAPKTVYTALNHAGLAVVGKATVSEQAYLYGRLGLGYTKQQERKTGAERTVSEASFGAGVHWAFSKQFGGRLEFNRIEKSKTNSTTLGIDYIF